MSLSELSPDDVQRLVRLLETHDLAELRYESNGVSVLLRAAVATAAPPPQIGATSLAQTAPRNETRQSVLQNANAQRTSAEQLAWLAGGGDFPTTNSATLFVVESPIAGTFYRAAAPGGPPLVDVGDMVEEGQPIGLIEAMKVFSEVLSERSGTISSIAAKDAAPVTQGGVLMTLDTTAGGLMAAGTGSVGGDEIERN